MDDRRQGRPLESAARRSASRRPGARPSTGATARRPRTTTVGADPPGETLPAGRRDSRRPVPRRITPAGPFAREKTRRTGAGMPVPERTPGERDDRRGPPRRSASRRPGGRPHRGADSPLSPYAVPAALPRRGKGGRRDDRIRAGRPPGRITRPRTGAEPGVLAPRPAGSPTGAAGSRCRGRWRRPGRCPRRPPSGRRPACAPCGRPRRWPADRPVPARGR